MGHSHGLRPPRRRLRRLKPGCAPPRTVVAPLRGLMLRCSGRPGPLPRRPGCSILCGPRLTRPRRSRGRGCRRGAAPPRRPAPAPPRRPRCAAAAVPSRSARLPRCAGSGHQGHPPPPHHPRAGWGSESSSPAPAPSASRSSQSAGPEALANRTRGRLTDMRPLVVCFPLQTSRRFPCLPHWRARTAHIRTIPGGLASKTLAESEFANPIAVVRDPAQPYTTCPAVLIPLSGALAFLKEQQHTARTQEAPLHTPRPRRQRRARCEAQPSCSARLGLEGGKIRRREGLPLCVSAAATPSASGAVAPAAPARCVAASQLSGRDQQAPPSRQQL